VEFALFEASFYNFATYLGATTGSYYRVDLDHCLYTGTTAERLLDAVRPAEPAGLLEVPLKLLCSNCELQFAGPDVRALSSTESSVRAIVLPDPSSAG
jgi:hypothetical protein